MKFETTVEVHLNEEEKEAWNTLFLAMRDLAHTPCEDDEMANEVNDFYGAMLNFADYIKD